MNDESKKILTMLSEGKITVDQAERLLEAINDKGTTTNLTGITTNKKVPKFLRIQVNNEDESRNVNIKVPIQILRSGVRLASIVPNLETHGIDLSKINPENIDEFITSLSDLTVDVHEKNDKVKIFCE